MGTDHHGWLFATSATGTVQWEQLFEPASGGALFCNSLAATTGGYLLACTRGQSGNPAIADSEAVVIRTDLMGQKQWEWTLDGPKWDAANVIFALSDGGALVGGERGTQDNYDAWVGRIDPWGNGQCAKAGVCASVALDQCPVAQGCLLATCDPKVGCSIALAPVGWVCAAGKTCGAAGFCSVP